MCEGRTTVLTRVSLLLALLALAPVLLTAGVGCREDTAPGSGDHVDNDTSALGDPCVNDDTDDPGGGCPYGYYCGDDSTCQQDCVDDDTCIQLHSMFWICNEYGQCEEDLSYE